MKKQANHLATPEGKIFATGIGLGCAWVVLLIGLTWTEHVVSGHLLRMLATGMVAGRAGGISLGQAMGLPTWLIVVNATMADCLTVLLLYPLFVFSTKNVVKMPLVNQVLGDSIRRAEARKSWVTRYGLIGLLFFVWFPLHMTGPLAGSIIGYFMGFHPYLTMAIVITGTFLAVLCWTFLFHSIAVWAGDLSYLIPVFVILVALIGFLVVRAQQRKKP
ncbi:MAG: small multi-drug export protein [Phycisphaeraceae bacterium]|nr:small multi-drug export protein [Phycisphaeraceae bacterium]